MLAQEIKSLSKAELLNLLVTNTQNFNIQDDILLDGYGIVLNEYLTSDNYVMEEKMLWGIILNGFYRFEIDIIAALYDSIGLIEMMGWCHDNLMSKTMIKNYYDQYMRFHKEKTSASEVLNAFLSAFIDDLGSMNPESLVDYAKDLGQELKKLPDIVKQQI